MTVDFDTAAVSGEKSYTRLSQTKMFECRKTSLASDGFFDLAIT